MNINNSNYEDLKTSSEWGRKKYSRDVSAVCTDQYGNLGVKTFNLERLVGKILEGDIKSAKYYLEERGIEYNIADHGDGQTSVRFKWSNEVFHVTTYVNSNYTENAQTDIYAEKYNAAYSAYDTYNAGGLYLTNDTTTTNVGFTADNITQNTDFIQSEQTTNTSESIDTVDSTTNSQEEVSTNTEAIAIVNIEAVNTADMDRNEKIALAKDWINKLTADTKVKLENIQCFMTLENKQKLEELGITLAQRFSELVETRLYSQGAILDFLDGKMSQQEFTTAITDAIAVAQSDLTISRALEDNLGDGDKNNRKQIAERMIYYYTKGITRALEDEVIATNAQALRDILGPEMKGETYYDLRNEYKDLFIQKVTSNSGYNAVAAVFKEDVQIALDKQGAVERFVNGQLSEEEFEAILKNAVANSMPKDEATQEVLTRRNATFEDIVAAVDKMKKTNLSEKEQYVEDLIREYSSNLYSRLSRYEIEAPDLYQEWLTDSFSKQEQAKIIASMIESEEVYQETYQDVIWTVDTWGYTDGEYDITLEELGGNSTNLDIKKRAEYAYENKYSCYVEDWRMPHSVLEYVEEEETSLRKDLLDSIEKYLNGTISQQEFDAIFAKETANHHSYHLDNELYANQTAYFNEVPSQYEIAEQKLNKITSHYIVPIVETLYKSMEFMSFTQIAAGAKDNELYHKIESFKSTVNTYTRDLINKLILNSSDEEIEQAVQNAINRALEKHSELKMALQNYNAIYGQTETKITFNNATVNKPQVNITTGASNTAPTDKSSSVTEESKAADVHAAATTSGERELIADNLIKQYKEPLLTRIEWNLPMLKKYEPNYRKYWVENNRRVDPTKQHKYAEQFNNVFRQTLQDLGVKEKFINNEITLTEFEYYVKLAISIASNSSEKIIESLAVNLNPTEDQIYEAQYLSGKTVTGLVRLTMGIDKSHVSEYRLV